MSVELEAAGLDSAGAWFRRRKPEHTRPPGSPCANCEAVLQGPWCHTCGQLAEDFHRSISHLLFEAVEGFTHFDGRFWRTVPRLITRPGQLTRDYIDGHRASQIPPLRLFLVVLLLFFFTGTLGGGRFNPVHLQRPGANGHGTESVRSLKELTPAERADVEKQLAGVTVSFGHNNEGASRWLRGRLIAALTDPERFTSALEPWLERFAFLMLPLAAALLSLLFVFQRRFYVFDHTIFALHSLSFQGLLLTAVFLLARVAPSVAPLLLCAAPVHLFMHMRRVYQTGVAGTLARMALLWIGSLIGIALLGLGLVWVGLDAMRVAV